MKGKIPATAVVLPGMLLLALACTGSPPPPAPELPFEQRLLDETGMARAFPADRVKDRAGWARDLMEVFEKDGISPTIGNTCAVVAVVEQESGYEPDPEVPGIGKMIDDWIAEKQESMGRLGGWAFEAGLKAVLDQAPLGEDKTFYQRLQAAKTERDVDVVYREFVAFQRAKWPGPVQRAEQAATSLGYGLDHFNPITTAGCMQVKVDFAEAHARKEGLDPALVRDALYTREGCLHYGTIRLLGFDADYDKLVYRFADYNAGLYASRNAAFQAQLALVSGQELALDGDLLSYDDLGRAQASSTSAAVMKVLAPEGHLEEWRILRDLELEKSQAFEQTDTYAMVREHYQTKSGKAPDYARLPDVQLDSVKLKGDKSTAWFAKNVDIRYQKCLGRLK